MTLTDVLIKEAVAELERQRRDLDGKSDRVIAVSLDLKLANNRRQVRAVEFNTRERRDLC